ncbi:hypothetical protein LC613_36090 [Nostoc sphaeroides CHAB 2801]|uniref:hypothetical protein n=1 Tax=Nostoc sphaeroides TaxID=446679 RepID=UPI001E391A7B|nr:hypothetical protein [Nostoc sphaeroides]MCC5632957.1 hypothetical protein [Nostoc sphaeroides CHAB 2801]
MSATNEPLVDVAVASLNDTMVGDATEAPAIIAAEIPIVKDSFENFVFILSLTSVEYRTMTGLTQNNGKT